MKKIGTFPNAPIYSFETWLETMKQQLTFIDMSHEQLTSHLTAAKIQGHIVNF